MQNASKKITLLNSEISLRSIPGRHVVPGVPAAGPGPYMVPGDPSDFTSRARSGSN